MSFSGESQIHRLPANVCLPEEALMEILRVGMPVVLLAGVLVAGCGGGGGGGGSSGTPFVPPTMPMPVQTSAGPTHGQVSSAASAMPLALPKGFQEPRGIAATAGGALFVAARDSSTLDSVILKVTGGQARVLATGGALGTSGVMTNPVSLALVGDTLYIADFSSDFQPGAAGAILSVATGGGAITVVSAGAIDGPTGITNVNGTLYVSGADPSDGEGAIFTVSTSGAVAQVAKGGNLTQPTGIGMGSNGEILVADAGAREASARLLSLSGTATALVSAISDSTVTNAGIASNGNETVVAARQGNAGRLSGFANGTGAESIFAEGSPLVSPTGVATDGKFFYVADADAGGSGLILIY
jgi:hypothetical protein